MNIQREPFEQCYAEALPLLEKHRQDLSPLKDVPLDVNEAAYAQLERTGHLRVYVARHEGVLVGYAVFVVAPSMHYQGSIQAQQDVLYVDPDHRHTEAVGLRLVRYCEQELRLEGVQVLYQKVKESHPTLGIILKRRGYVKVESTHMKRLDTGE